MWLHLLHAVPFIFFLFSSPSAAFTTNKFVPRKSGEKILFIGQDVGSIREYNSYVSKARPSGVTAYTGISDNPDRSFMSLYEATTEFGYGVLHASSLLNDYPGACMALGLTLIDSLDDVNKGRRDDKIDDLGNYIKASGVPFFLRIGFEFDGPWNNYPPEEYKAAYRRIVYRLRGGSVDNFVSVWQVAASGAGTKDGRDIRDWWPGDDVVDWMGLSSFEAHKPSLGNLLGFAREKGKPVMIAEAAPRGYDLKRKSHAGYNSGGKGRTYLKSKEIWDRWYQPFFDFIVNNDDTIRAVAYINANWDSQPRWGPPYNNGYWGDSRINRDGGLTKKME